MVVKPATPRRLVVVGPTPPPYHGVTIYTARIVSTLRSLGLLAAHLDTRDPRPVDTVGRLDVRNSLLALRHGVRLVRLIAASPGATVYVPLSQGRWGFTRDALFVAVARAARRPVIGHLHGGAFDRFYAGSGPLMRLVIRRAVAALEEVWVLTPSLRSVFDGLTEDDRIFVVQNAVPEPIPDPGASAAPRDDERGFRLLYLSNLLPDKGCFDLLDALDELGDAAAGWTVRIAGEAEPDVAAQVAERGARLARRGCRLDFVGEVAGEAKAGCWSWADAFVLPTRFREGQPLVILEAMAAGLPIVTTDHPGITDTARPDREAVVVEPADPRGLARALLQLAEDPALRERLGSSGRERYEASYRPERLRDDLARLLGATGDGAPDGEPTHSPENMLPRS
jgi:glycosyltransferase involved in cell wall biosynthesis